jgi:hypothetical protein
MQVEAAGARRGRLLQAHPCLFTQVDRAMAVAELVVAVLRLFQLALQDRQLLVQEGQRLFRLLGLARQVLAHVLAPDLAQQAVDAREFSPCSLTSMMPDCLPCSVMTIAVWMPRSCPGATCA